MLPQHIKIILGPGKEVKLIDSNNRFDGKSGEQYIQVYETPQEVSRNEYHTVNPGNAYIQSDPKLHGDLVGKINEVHQGHSQKQQQQINKP